MIVWKIIHDHDYFIFTKSQSLSLKSTQSIAIFFISFVNGNYLTKLSFYFDFSFSLRFQFTWWIFTGEFSNLCVQFNLLITCLLTELISLKSNSNFQLTMKIFHWTQISHNCWLWKCVYGKSVKQKCQPFYFCMTESNLLWINNNSK